MPFSVSIGDVIALCEVTIKLGEAIGAGRDAPKDYKRLKREVDRFQQLLDDMEPLCDREPSPATERLLKPLLREMEECKDALTAFIQKNPCPESILTKVLWVFRGPKRCALLREELSTYRQSLAMRVNSFYAQEQKSLLLLCSTGMLPMRDLSPKLETIIVIDPVGEHIQLPMFLSTSYELLVTVLKAYYKHQSRSIPGRSYVVRGDFDLVHGGDKQVVETTRWNEIFNPHLKVEMSMILRRNGAPTDICPRCRSSFHGDALDGWATCRSCDGQFHIKQKVEEMEEPVIESTGNEEITTPSVAADKEMAPSSGDPSSRLENQQQPEWALFRLLSVVSTVFKFKPQVAQHPDAMSFSPMRQSRLSRVLLMAMKRREEEAKAREVHHSMMIPHQSHEPILRLKPLTPFELGRIKREAEEKRLIEKRHQLEIESRIRALQGLLNGVEEYRTSPNEDTLLWASNRLQMGK